MKQCRTQTEDYGDEYDADQKFHRLSVTDRGSEVEKQQWE
jgi:hypothetical protein